MLPLLPLDCLARFACVCRARRAVALRVNVGLKSLSLRDTGIGTEGAAALGEALHENFTLTTLKVSADGIDDACVCALQQACRGRISLGL